jgi:hypothetical protein
MANKIPNTTLGRLLDGTFDLDTDDIRARLVMTDTTCDTEIDAINNLADYTTIDPADATGYADVALTGKTITVNDVDNRAEYDTTSDIEFTGLSGDATRNYQGVLIYKYVDGTNANDLPIMYIDFTSPIAKEATTVTIPSSSTNLLRSSQV